MNQLTFSLNHCGPISQADIELNGLTIVAGENGSGKSTLSRWINAAITVMNNYASMVEEDGKRGLSNIILEISRALPFNTEAFAQLDRQIDSFLHNVHRTRLRDFMDMASEAFMLVNEFTRLLGNQSDNSGTNSPEAMTGQELKRLSSYLGINGNDIYNAKELSGIIRSRYHNRIQECIRGTEIKKQTRTSENFSHYISEMLFLDESSERTCNVSLIEDDVELLSANFMAPLSITRTIYLDTRRLCEYLAESWRKTGMSIGALLRTKNEAGPSEAVLHLLNDLRVLIGGDVSFQKETIRNLRNDFHFVTPTGLDIPLIEAATGIISFSILLRLMQNGWIEKGTLLIIDEPEAHMHPQWIVEYARLLVRLHKEAGVRIMISTHNPDMVAAVESISLKEEVIDNTRFYLTEPDKNEGIPTYHTHTLGREIGEIFTSFNIALDRIAQYGIEA